MPIVPADAKAPHFPRDCGVPVREYVSRKPKSIWSRPVVYLVGASALALLATFAAISADMFGHADARTPQRPRQTITFEGGLSDEPTAVMAGSYATQPGIYVPAPR